MYVVFFLGKFLKMGWLRWFSYEILEGYCLRVVRGWGVIDVKGMIIFIFVIFFCNILENLD